MRRTLLLFLVLMGTAATSRAQSEDQFSITFTRSKDVSGLTVNIVSRGSVPVLFGDGATVLRNVRLYRISNPNRPIVHNEPIDCAFAGIHPSDEYVTLWIALHSTCSQISPDGFPLAEGAYFLEIKAAALVYNSGKPAPALNDVYPPMSIKAASATIDTAGDVANRYGQIRVNHPDIPLSTAGVATTNFQRITPRLTCLKGHNPDAILVRYQNWLSCRPWYLSDVRVAIGPRVETDRSFQRQSPKILCRFAVQFVEMACKFNLTP